MKKYLFGVALLAISSIAASAFAAGDLVTDGTITQVVTRKTSPAEAFSVLISGGSGPCAGSTINFPGTGSASTDDGMRSIAVAAFLSGKPVRIYTYSAGTDCTKGEYIRIEN